MASLLENMPFCFTGAISLKDTLKLVQIQCEEFLKLKERSALCNRRGLSRHEVELINRQFNCHIANVISNHSARKGNATSENNVYACGGKAGGW